MATNWILNDKGPIQPVNTQVDASASSIPHTNNIAELTALMRRSVYVQDRILAAQNRQNELLTTIIEAITASGRQRSTELAQWKQANPRLARACKDASEKLGQLQTDFIDSLSDEIDMNFDTLQEGDFVLGEFVDKYGPRVAYLSSLMQLLSQLGNAPDTAAQQRPGN